MKKNIYAFLIILCFISLYNHAEADEPRETVCSPFDTSRVYGISPGSVTSNNEGGYLIVGTLSRKQTVPFEYTPDGIFLLNLVPDLDSIYKIKYYTEFYMEKALFAYEYNTEAYFKENGNAVVVFSHNYHDSGPWGSLMFKLPLVLEFDSTGKFLSQTGDTVVPMQLTQIWGNLCPIVLNDDKSFNMFHYATDYSDNYDSSKYYQFVSHYDPSGHLIEKKVVFSMVYDTIGNFEGVEYSFDFLYHPVIQDKDKNTYLSIEKTRHYGNNVQERKFSTVLMKLDSNMKIVKEKEFAEWKYDNIEKKQFLSTNIYKYFINQDNELVISGTHYAKGHAVAASLEFVIFLNPDDLSEIRRTEWWKDDKAPVSSPLMQTMNREYIAVGNFTDTGNSEYLTAWKLNKNLKKSSILKLIKLDAEINSIAKIFEVEDGAYDFILRRGNNISIMRVTDSDFQVGITDAPLPDGTSFSYSSGNLLINTPLSGMANIKIFDVLGNKVFETEKYLSDEIESLRLGNMSNGVFIVAVEIEGEHRVGKIIVGE